MAQYEMIVSELEQLLERMRGYRATKAYAGFYEVLTFIKQSRYLAPYNALLVMQQRPDATLVLRDGEINKRFNRRLKPQVQPIVIMKRFGPVEFVYDVKDIDGIEENPIPGYQPNLPTEEVCRIIFPVDGDLRGIQGLFDDLLSRCRKQGLTLQELPEEITQAGQVQLKPRHMRLERKEVTGQNRLANYIMQINRLHPAEIRFAALIHELAHIHCQHFNEFEYTGFERLPLELEEFEAEAVAYLFCYRYGFRPRSEQYLCRLLAEGHEPSVTELDVILKALHRIEELLKPEVVTGVPGKFSFRLVDHHSLTECRLKLKGKELHYDYDGPMDQPRHEMVKPTIQQWDAFWLVCGNIGLWNWEAACTQSEQENHSEWSLSIQAGERQVTATGKNSFPGGSGSRLQDCSPAFAKLLKALKRLTGQSFGYRPSNHP